MCHDHIDLFATAATDTAVTAVFGLYANVCLQIDKLVCISVCSGLGQIQATTDCPACKTDCVGSATIATESNVCHLLVFT